jgi:hypothetical protein
MRPAARSFVANAQTGCDEKPELEEGPFFVDERLLTSGSEAESSW